MAGFVFNIEMMMEMGNARDVVPKTIFDMMAEDEDIMYVMSDAATAKSHMSRIQETYPNHCVDVGIAESNLVGAAAGMALSGKKVFATAFGPFLSLRATDQICLDVAYNQTAVCVIGTHGGLTSGGGPTHYTIMDSAIMRAMPNMTMVIPSDANQCIRVLKEFVKNPRPMYVRVARGEEPLVYENQEYGFEIGKAVTIKVGEDATIIGTGIGVSNGLMAAAELEKEGVNVRVIDMHTIKPMDADAVIKAAKETGIIVTVEDSNINGGLGGGVAEILAEANVDCKFKRLGIPDVFAKLGYPETLYPYYGFDAAGIVRQIKAML